MTLKILLRPRIATQGWNKGKAYRGDREIWLCDEDKALEYWGHITMEQHGCHGPSYHFWDARGNMLEMNDREVTIRSKRSRKWSDDQDTTPTEELLRAKVAEVIEAGVLRPPAILQAEAEKHSARMAAIDAEIEQEREQVRRALLWAHRVANDPDTRAGIAIAYKDIFHGPIEKETT
jgi:hypothetical protein